MSKATIKAAWITGISTIIAAIIGVFITQNGCNNSGSPEKVTVHQETDSGSNYNAGRDNIHANSGSTVVTANDSSKVNITINAADTRKVLPTNIKPVQTTIDQSVNSYNQSGGITAREVTVNVPSEDDVPDIDIPNNFIIDTSIVNENFVFKVKPKVGHWDSTFIAFPESEKTEVEAQFSNGSGIMLGRADGTMNGPLNGKIVRYEFFLCFGEQATFKKAFMIICKKRPSIIMFGSMGSANKQYFFPITARM